LKDSGSIPPSPAQPAPQQAQQQYAQQPPPQYCKILFHIRASSTPSRIHNIPHLKWDNITIPTIQQSEQFSSPAKRKSFYKHVIVSTLQQLSLLPHLPETNPTPTGPPLFLPRPSAEPPLRIPRIPLRRNVHNPQAQAAHNYSLVDDLAQSPAAMSVLEVLQTCPTQWKSLLSAMGAVDPADTRLITFDLDNCEPRLPAAVTIQIPVKIRNITVHRCIIDEGASTCIMSKSVWQKLGSPERLPSAITLRAYDGRSAAP
jgi:hypothetical protein